MENYKLILLLCVFYQVCEFLTERHVEESTVERFREEKVRLLFRSHCMLMWWGNVARLI